MIVRPARALGVLLLASVLAGTGRARAPNHPEAGRVLVRLAEARAAQGQVAEALLDLRRRWIEAPASGWGEAARETMEDLGRVHGLTIPPLTPDEALVQAQRLADGGEAAAAIR